MAGGSSLAPWASATFRTRTGLPVTSMELPVPCKQGYRRNEWQKRRDTLIAGTARRTHRSRQGPPRTALGRASLEGRQSLDVVRNRQASVTRISRVVGHNRYGHSCHRVRPFRQPLRYQRVERQRSDLCRENGRSVADNHETKLPIVREPFDGQRPAQPLRAQEAGRAQSARLLVRKARTLRSTSVFLFQKQH